MHKPQFEIDFTPGLTDQFPEWMDVVRASVYGCGRPFKVIAADLDMSASELSRKLAENPGDNVNFPLKRAPDLLRATGDLRPLHWLIESFMESPDAKRNRAIETLSAISKELPKLLKQASL